MNMDALQSMTYGMFILGTLDGERPTGCVVNTVFQVSAQPPIFAMSVSTSNFTNDCIKRTGKCSVCILSESADPNVIRTFGFRSGCDISKFDSIPYRLTSTGLPVLTDELCGYLELRIIHFSELSTHTLFLGELIGGERYSFSNPMTYSYYHRVIKGSAPKAAPIYHGEEVQSMSQEKYKCTICGYVYDGSDGPFEELPDDWKCPVCGAGKSLFKKIS